ncbi:MAG TPA: hypothetical protein VIK86_10040 [Candidatus Paceibacterota bacterium]
MKNGSLNFNNASIEKIYHLLGKLRSGSNYYYVDFDDSNVEIFITDHSYKGGRYYFKPDYITGNIKTITIDTKYEDYFIDMISENNYFYNIKIKSICHTSTNSFPVFLVLEVDNN